MKQLASKLRRQKPMEIFSKIVLSLILFYMLFLTWSKPVDISLWLKNAVETFIPFKAPATKVVVATASVDAVFAWPPNASSHQAIWEADTGALTAIVDIWKKSDPKQLIEFKLEGQWNGKSGIVPVPTTDVVVFNSPEKLFLFIQKKISVVEATAGMTDILEGVEYVINVRAFPHSLAIPLMPVAFSIRNAEGIVYNIGNFVGNGKGQYQASFTF